MGRQFSLTSKIDAFNTLVGFFLVLGIGPFPKLGVLGAGAATLLAQAIRCIVLLTAMYRKQNGIEWRWPWQCPELGGISVPEQWKR
jgi:Na+-driven multidrug efflux pump